jgi:hypothetical protein
MAEKLEVASKLDEVGVLTAIRWAYLSAVARTLNDYSEDAGHDATWLGITRFGLFRDRLDRVFSCGRYALQVGADGSEGLDLLRAELPDADIVSMPRIAPGEVRRSDLNRSPGWLVANIRFLIASSSYGHVKDIPWPRTSPTKQRVAIDGAWPGAPTLFDDMPLDEIGGLIALAHRTDDVDTFVVGHSLNAVNNGYELVFGRPRFNAGGGAAWEWLIDLASLAAPSHSISPTQPAVSADPVPDAPVRLRESVSDSARTGGEA